MQYLYADQIQLSNSSDSSKNALWNSFFIIISETIPSEFFLHSFCFWSDKAILFKSK